MKTSLSMGALLLASLPLVGHAEPRCKGDRPIGPGITRQGGYSFQYQSTTRAGYCVGYQLRNNPGKVWTPAIWKQGDEILIDANLPECAMERDCEWVSVVKTIADPTSSGGTVLSYGINKDEFKDHPAAYVIQPPERRSAAVGELQTVIEGLVADDDHRKIRIGVRVTSAVKPPGPEGYRLVYFFERLGDSVDLSVLASPSENRPDAVALVLDSGGSEAFANAMRKVSQSVLTSGRSYAQVEVEARGLPMIRSRLLAIYRGSKPIASTTARLYVPAE